jgi:hypothetical protein
LFQSNNLTNARHAALDHDKNEKSGMVRNLDRSRRIDAMFNISGYKLGDFKHFFNDPRTRRDYLKWAHLLLTAEEYHAGSLDPVTFEKRT